MKYLFFVYLNSILYKYIPEYYKWILEHSYFIHFKTLSLFHSSQKVTEKKSFVKVLQVCIYEPNVSTWIKYMDKRIKGWGPQIIMALAAVGFPKTWH